MNESRMQIQLATLYGDPIAAIPTRRYFVTDAWVGVGGHLHRYEVTGPEGFVSLHKTYGEAMAKADSLETS